VERSVEQVDDDDDSADTADQQGRHRDGMRHAGEASAVRSQNGQPRGIAAYRQRHAGDVERPAQLGTRDDRAAHRAAALDPVGAHDDPGVPQIGLRASDR
jgi:hypothetical protein